MVTLSAPLRAARNRPNRSRSGSAIVVSMTSPWTLAGSTALVTGASRGIGRAIAEELLELGARCLVVARDPAALDEAVLDLASRTIADRGGSLVITEAGRVFARDFGVCLDDAGKRPLCKACLDWSVRRSHLAGAFGIGLLDRIYALGWARRVEGTRIVAFSAPGQHAFEQTFGRIGGNATAAA